MYRSKPVALAVFAACTAIACQTSAQTSIEEMVVTGVRSDAPLQLITNPKNPRQPLPAHDGADYLKTIPGFSVIRKGGTAGDPVLRGMAGSRLSMLMDGEVILGGCNNRMDPPTAYVFPETYDSIRVIKGPQSVQYGPGNSAGVVLFEKDDKRPENSGLQVHSSILAGSFGRLDEVVDLRYATPEWELRTSASNASADNYEDGDGVEVHSQYKRWNGQVDLAWTPDDNTRFELSTAHSDGEAAYADRSVDGSKFARENYSAKFIKSALGPVFNRIELQAYYNYVDHVMDNYSLREPAGMMANPVAMNPDRTTSGGKAIVDFTFSDNMELTAGVDTQTNQHSSRNTMNQTMIPFEAMTRIEDSRFAQTGVFGELNWKLGSDQNVIAGLRLDRWEYLDQRQNIALSMMSTLPNPTADIERKETLHSAFARFEDTLGDSGLTWYAGVGHNERLPDYWEITKESATSLSSVNSLKAEKNTQLDTGILFKGEGVETSLSVFYSDVQDYIMVQNSFNKMAMAMPAMPYMPMMGGMDTMTSTTRSTTIVRNIDARSWGMEFDSQYYFSENWRVELTLASVRGANDTDNTTLAQLPPLEGRLGFYYDNKTWSAGLLWRSLAAQNRVDIGKGNIIGQDFGPTGSAEILSLNAGWRANDRVLVTTGIDNLLDETYAEHISRAGAAIQGFEQVSRLNEPGRILWMKAQYSF